MSSLIGVQCVIVEELPAHAPVEKRVLAKEMRPMKSQGGHCTVTVTCREWRKEWWRTRRLPMESCWTLRR